MFAIERGKSAWLCTTSIEAFEVDAVQLRLQGELKDFAVFEQRLTEGEIINAGVIKIYKCDDATCEDCTKHKGCIILQKVLETEQVHTEFFRWVEENGGYTL